MYEEVEFWDVIFVFVSAGLGIVYYYLVSDELDSEVNTMGAAISAVLGIAIGVSIKFSTSLERKVSNNKRTVVFEDI